MQNESMNQGFRAIELSALSYYARVFIHRIATLSPLPEVTKKFKKHGSDRAEGFQRAIGKPFGRLRRGETPATKSID